MTSLVDIYNRALDKLGAESIVDPAQDIENARVMNRAYTIVLNSMLRAHAWNCAKTRVVLAPLSDAPAFDYDYQFQWPADCLRPLLPRCSDWVIEGRRILTSEGSTLNLIYIRTLDDPNDMDASFVEVLACKMAFQACEKITQSNTKKTAISEELKQAWSEAAKANAFERNPEPEESSSWVDARITGPYTDPMKVSRYP